MSSLGKSREKRKPAASGEGKNFTVKKTKRQNRNGGKVNQT
jgi:hypothetical protein